MPAISMKVNGKAVCGDVENRTLLVDFIRTNLGLTGTHVGCDTSQCGACVVHVDGKAVKSCTTLAVACEGSEALRGGADEHAASARETQTENRTGSTRGIATLANCYRQRSRPPAYNVRAQ